MQNKENYFDSVYRHVLTVLLDGPEQLRISGSESEKPLVDGVLLFTELSTSTIAL